MCCTKGSRRAPGGYGHWSTATTPDSVHALRPRHWPPPRRSVTSDRSGDHHLRSTLVNFAADRRPNALIGDWGGAPTPPVESTMSAWADADDVDLDDFGQVMREWFGEPGE